MMFLSLVNREVRYQLRNTVLYIVILVVIAFYITQFASEFNTGRFVSLKPNTEYEATIKYFNWSLKTNTLQNSNGHYYSITEIERFCIEDNLKLLETKYIIDSNGNKQYKDINEYNNMLKELDIKLGSKSIFNPKVRDFFYRTILNYGTKEITDNNQKILITVSSLINDYNSSFIATYPYGLYKEVKLTKERKDDIYNALKQIITEPLKHINNPNSLRSDVIICDYDTFNQAMSNLNQKLGGGSSYEFYQRQHTYQTLRTFNEAMINYNSIVNDDKFSRMFARLYADYMGITAGLLPIFISAFILLKDKKSNMAEIIQSKQISSLKYILSKFLAATIIFMGIFFVISLVPTFKTLNIAKDLNITVDIWAFIKVTILWIYPTMMFVLAIGMFLSVLFGKGIITIPIQYLLWSRSLVPLFGSYGLGKFIIRCNTLISHQEFASNIKLIYMNRMFYVLLSFIVIIGTSYIYNKRRCGYAKK